MTIVDEFEYKGHKCVITKERLLALDSISEERRNWYHNGYIKMLDEIPEESMIRKLGEEGGADVTFHLFRNEIETDALTFSGQIPDNDGYWFGFDSAKFKNFSNPETQTEEAVRERTKEMVDEFEEKNIFERVDDILKK